MGKNILLAVDAASGDPARHVSAAAAMTRELSRETHVGHIAAAILKAAGEHDARIVVLGSSSRTDLPRMLLGSVASRLLHMATRPVLIVPRSDTPTQAIQPLAAATAAGEH